MAVDAYIKFGEGTDRGPDNKLLPKIEGDSDDEQHYWWCELRSCDFDMETSEHAESDEDADEEKKSKAELKPITIKKRVDWASTQLFTLCCEAAESTTKMADAEDSEKGRLKEVFIEVCRQSDNKFPFLVVKYTGVTIVKYGIDMSGPEPSETITFKAEMAQFEYQRTDPETGAKKGGPARTGELPTYVPSAAAGGGGDAAAAAVSAAAIASEADSVFGPGGMNPNGAGDAEGALNSSFPGLLNSSSIGLLSD
jgi:type VI protein secretion system component Hcp